MEVAGLTGGSKVHNTFTVRPLVPHQPPQYRPHNSPPTRAQQAPIPAHLLPAGNRIYPAGRHTLLSAALLKEGVPLGAEHCLQAVSPTRPASGIQRKTVALRATVQGDVTLQDDEGDGSGRECVGEREAGETGAGDKYWECLLGIGVCSTWVREHSTPG